MKNVGICFLLAAAASAAINTNPPNAEVRIVPLIRSGIQGDWEFRTSFILHNKTNQPVDYRVDFFCEHGKSIELTIAGPSEKLKRAQLSGQLTPHQALSYIADSKPAKMEELVWARVSSSAPGALSFETVGLFMQPKGQEKYFSTAPVPADSRQGTLVFVGGEDLLLVNDSSASQTVRLTAYSEAGKELCRAEKTLSAGQLLVNQVTKVLTCADKTTGTIDISAPRGVAMMGLRYAGSIHPLYPARTDDVSGPLQSNLEDRVKEIFDILTRPARKEEQ